MSKGKMRLIDSIKSLIDDYAIQVFQSGNKESEPIIKEIAFNAASETYEKIEGKLMLLAAPFDSEKL